MHRSIVVVVASVIVVVLALLQTTEAKKEKLPPEAYLNRTVYPPLVEYDPNHMPHLSVGLISDVQFAEQEESNRRHFKLSLGKLKQAIEEMNVNRTHLDFVVHLGDLVDHSMERFLPILKPELEKLKYPLYQVLGNHDFLMTDEKKFKLLHEKLGMPAKYYSFLAGPQKRYRFVVLDGNDIATYSSVTNSPERRAAEEWIARLKRMRAKNANNFNGAVGDTQIQWMKTQLEEATEQNQRVILFIHHPMKPKGESTNLWNDMTIIPIISAYKCVIAVVNGHAHKYMYDFHHTVHRTVHFITFGGMVQSPFQTFGFMDVYEDVLRIHGLIFGRPIDYHYDLAEKTNNVPPVTAHTVTKKAVVVGDGVKNEKNGPAVTTYMKDTPNEIIQVSPKPSEMIRREENDSSAASNGGTGFEVRGQLAVLTFVLVALLLVGIVRVTRWKLHGGSGRSARR